MNQPTPISGPQTTTSGEVASRVASGELEYVGFFSRFLAFLVDSILALVIIFPLLVAFYGSDMVFSEDPDSLLGTADLIISYIFPFVATVLFWHYLSATPGKMVVSAQVVDATTGRPLTFKQSVIRYLGYFVSSFLLFLGFIWIIFDPKKQGLHDKMAGSVVIRKARGPKSTPG